MSRSRLVVISLVVLAASVSTATAGEALDRIERILMVAQDFDHGMPPSADLTTEINALRAQPVDDVLAALREALDLGRVEGSMAHTFVPLVSDIARLVTNTPRHPRDESEPSLFVVEGAILLRGDSRRNSTCVHEVPRLVDIVGKNPGSGPPLTPDGAALLDLLLTRPGRLDLADRVQRDSLAAALGIAAESDDALRKRLVKAVRVAVPAAASVPVLAHALAPFSSVSGDAALSGLLERAASRGPGSVGEIVRALLNAGKYEIIDGVRTRLVGTGDEATLPAFDRAAGSWFGARRRVAAMPEEPCVEDVRRLAAIAGELGSIPTYRELLDLLLPAYSHDDTPPEQAALAREALRKLLWPRWLGRTEAAVAREGCEPAGISVTGWGGNPATSETLEWRISLAYESPLRWTPKPFDPVAWSPLAPRREYVLADRPAKGVHVVARRTPRTIRVAITNEDDEPLIIKPSAFEYAAARSVVVTTKTGSTSEFRLTAGALGRGMVPVFHDENCHRLAPGETRTFTLALPDPVPSGARVVVEFFDPSEPHPDYGPPEPGRRLRSFRGVPAVIDDIPLTGADRRARALLDRIVYSYETGDEELDLGAAVQELLSLGPDVLTRTFRTALDRGSWEGTPAGARWEEILSLATSMRGLPPHRTGTPWENEFGFRNLEGLLVFVADYGGFYSGPTPTFVAPPGLADLPGKFPERLVPDPEAFLARCRTPDKRVKRWLSIWAFPEHAGRSLGHFARGDSEWSKRIVEELRLTRFQDIEKRDPVGLILAHAAGWIGDEAAVAVLREKVDALIPWKKGTGRWRNLSGCVDALRAAGDLDFLRSRAAALGHGVVDDLRVEALLQQAANELTAPALSRLGAALRGSEMSPETGLEILDLALRYAGSKDKTLQPAAQDLVVAVLWPYNQYPVNSSWSSSWSPRFGGPPAETLSVVEKGRGVGGWPDPVAGARWLRQQVRDGGIRILPLHSTRRSLFTNSPGDRIDGRWVGELVEFVPRREGDRLRIAVTNRASGPVCVNPLAFRLATAEVVTVKERRDGRISHYPKVKLSIGWGFFHFDSVISPEQLRVLRPGETAEFTFALEPGLSKETRIRVGFRDPFVVDGPLPYPRLSGVGDVAVK